VPKPERSGDDAEPVREEGSFPGARESALNLRRLRYFARIVEAGNITRAAEQLYVAQPALGLQIRQLEQALGVSLLERHSRGVSPTRAGRMLYERACEVLRLVDDTERVVTAAGRHEREHIVLGLTNGVMSMVGRDIVMAAGRELPSIQLNLVEEMSGALMDSLEREELDIAIAYDAHERPGLLRVPLLLEEPLFVCAAEGAATGPIEFSELAAQPLVVPGVRDVVRRQLDAAARRLAVALNVTMEVSSIAARKALVEYGDAATIMAYGSVCAEVGRGRLATRRIVNPALHRTLYLVRSLRRAEFKHERELIDFLGRIVLTFSERMGELATRLPALDRPLSQSVAEVEASGMGDGEPLP
jgi:LysR family nitrogen assimilation transcriptional regulator